MRISNQWLLEWVDHGLSPEELGHRLTMAGLELDALEAAAGEFSGVVVGHVLQVEPHPDADKLRVCQVEDGSGSPVQVVCGAPNVVEGMKVPFARVGAVLPGEFKIKKAKLRGVESFGMLCSARELGLAETSEGLMPLPLDLAAGADGFFVGDGGLNYQPEPEPPLDPDAAAWADRLLAQTGRRQAEARDHKARP